MKGELAEIVISYLKKTKDFFRIISPYLPFIFVYLFLNKKKPRKERKWQRIQESPDFAYKVLEKNPEKVYVYDYKSREVIYINGYPETSVGHTIEDIVKKGHLFFQSLVHPDDLPSFIEHQYSLAALKDGEKKVKEIRLQHSDGSWIWFSLTDAVFSRDLSGEVTEIVGTAIEITEKKLREEELKESRFFINSVVNTSPNDIYVIDLVNSTNIFTTKNSTKNLGYTPEELNKFGDRLVPTLVHPDDLHLIQEKQERLKNLQTDETLSYELRWKHSSGEYRWFKLDQRPFKRNEKGEVTQIVGVSTDITERKEAEMQLEESRKFAIAIAETSPNIIFIAEVVKNKIIYINKAIEKLLGYSPEEHLKRIENDLFSIVHPEDKENVFNHMQHIQKSGNNGIWEVEYRVKDKYGEWHWMLESDGVFKRDSEGKVEQTIGVAVDITERKRTQEKLKDFNRYIQKINETIPNPIYIFDLKSQEVININFSVIHEILGYSPEETEHLKGRVVTELIHPEDQPLLKEHIKNRINDKAGRVKHLDVRIRDVENNWIWFNIRDTVFQRDFEGNPTQILGIATDINDRKTMEEQVRELNRTLESKVKIRTQELNFSRERLKVSESLLLLVANAIPAIVTYINDKEEFRFANLYFRQTLDINENISIIGKPIKDIVSGSLYSKVKPWIDQALTGETVVFEIEIPQTDQSPKTFRVTYTPDFKPDGSVNGFIAMGVDLSDKLEYEKNLEGKNDELKRINADLDNFIYTASHDLRSPISNIEGLLSNLNEDVKKECQNGEVKYLLELVNVSLQRLKTTIAELTEISRIQKNINEAEEDIEVSSFINDFITEHTETIQSINARITTNLHVKSIRFAKKNFRSIVNNLLGNAIKYRSPDRDPEILVKTEEQGNWIVLSVKDNGIGFDIRKKSKIFSMFKRLHAHVEGTGVGLYIIKRIVENSGGRIDVESKEGQGSVFKVYFKKTD